MAFPVQAEVVISEIMAQNDGGLHDADGATPDWIELHNTGAAADLSGWHLTDSPGNLGKWTFPTVQMEPGSYLVIFASGKDRATNGFELHTNFQLDQDGGYIALVQPNSNIAYSVAYPNQRANVSYGIGASNTVAVVLASNANARWFLPSNDSLGLTWTAPNFNDAAWTSSGLPLRYDVGSGGGLSVDVNARSGDTGANTQPGFSTFTMSAASGIQTGPTVRNYGAFSVTLSNSSAGIGYDDRLRAAPSNGGSYTLQNIHRDFIFSRESSGTSGLDLYIAGLAAGQQYDFVIWSFDASSAGSRVSDWFANGVSVTNNYTFNGSVLPADDSQNRFTFRATANLSGGILVSARRDSTSVDQLNAASFGVFLNGFQVTPVIPVPVTNGNVASMAAITPSVYARIPFTVSNPGAYDTLKLRMRYDDGFIAYLNGVEIARRHAPATALFNSQAAATNSAAAVEEIVMPGAASLMVTGANVLAIQGLNVAANDADFYLQPELIAVHTVDITNRYFAAPSPGRDNETGYLGLVSDTKFSSDRGFYDAPFSLSITSATAGAQVRYTLDGSVPTAITGIPFTIPITISNQSFVRAAAFLPGYISSGVDTHSYIFLRNVLKQSNNIPGYPTLWQASYPADYAMDSNIVNHPVYGQTISNDLRSLASLCIVADQNGLWNSSTGIYPNPTSIGEAWERATSIELISGSGKSEFATTCKVQVHGNASRDNNRTPKHSLGLSFSSDYGPTKLRYDWFGGGIDTFDGIVLRSCGFVDGWAGRYADEGLYVSTETGETFRGERYRPENTCYLRDAWVKDSFRDMGWPSSRSAYVHLYINGLYWGLYEPSEHVDASWFALRFGGDDGAWDVLVGEDNNGPPVIVDGSVDDWQNVLNIVNAGITSEASYQALAQLVDLDNLIDYMLLHIFAESEDWPRHNWYMAHRRATNGLPATKFICTVWDQELTLDRLVRRSRVDVGTSGGEVYSPARVYSQLRSWPEFRRQFGDRVQKHLFNGGALTASNCVQRLLGPAALIRNAVVGESARWGDARKFPTPGGPNGTGHTFTRDEWWQPEVDKLTTNFLQTLGAVNIARLRAALLYPNIGSPTFNQFGGAVTNGFTLAMSHTNGAGVIYFTTDGSDPRLYGSGGVAPSAQAYATPIPINTPTLVRARVSGAAGWSALVEATFYPPQDLGKLAVTEIMYNPPGLGATNGDEFEFLELKNTGTNTLNLSGLTFRDGIVFTFTNGTLIGPGAFFVLARNPVAFASQHPLVPVNGVYTGKLDNGGEKVTLSHALGTTIFSVTYDDTAPWPAGADGLGFSLVPVNGGLTQAPDSGFRWRASAFAGGSPGADDPLPAIPPIVINEFLTHTDLPAVDRIEIFNPTETNVDVGGWFLTDDPDEPKKYRISNGTVIPGFGFVTFDESQFNATPGTNGSFSLSSRGEQVYLFSADSQTNLTGYSHGISFGAAAGGVSFGRYVNSVGEEQFPAQVANSFGASNNGPRIGPLVINEIHYHPPLGEVGFIELKNITGAPLQLFDPAHATNTWKVDGVDFTLPENLTVPALGYLLIVETNPATFIARYSVPANVIVLGPYGGGLQHDGERLELKRPDPPDTNGVPYIAFDSVRYNDKAPWPAAADGGGASLQRIASSSYGDDPMNWQAAAPTPGRDNAEQDSDGDGIPDSWELANGTNPFVPDAFDDPDGDGVTNLQEYFSGTGPHDPGSFLHTVNIHAAVGGLNFEFEASSNHSYRVLFKERLDASTWLTLTNVPATATRRTIVVSDVVTNASRFYRLVTP